jgi:hypothetical protein
MFTTRVATITAAGSAGSATGTAAIGVPPCLLAGLGITFEAGTPGTVDVEIVNVLGGQERQIWSRSNDNSDLPLTIPSEDISDNTGSDLDVPGPDIVSGTLVINVTGSNAGKQVIVTMLLKVGP